MRRAVMLFGRANVAAVEDEAIVDVLPIFFGYECLKLF